jgi:hypothetical protein
MMKQRGIDNDPEFAKRESGDSEEHKPALIMVIAPILGGILWIIIIYIIFS